MWPGIDRETVLDQVEQPGFIEVAGRALIQRLHFRQDDAVVDEAAGVVLQRQDLIDAEPGQRVPVGQDVVQGQEQVGPASAGLRSGARRPTASRGRMTRACAHIRRAIATSMKKRSTGTSAAHRWRCSRYAATMLALWARYQVLAEGALRKPAQRATAGLLASPGLPAASRSASHASRSRLSLTERHHRLPGRADSGGTSTPRLTCHRMNASSARR